MTSPYQVDSIESMTLEKVSFSYEGSQSLFVDFSLDVPVNKIIRLVGQAGGGQSTLLKLLAVLLRPTSGRYLMNGSDTTEMSFEEFLPFRKKIGFTFDYGGLFANRTLRENISLPLMYHKIYPREEIDEKVNRYISEFRFSTQADLRPASVSGGLRKLVCLLRALIAEPEMLVMDDPFTGLDVESAHRIIEQIQNRRSQGGLKHVFFSSRDEVYPKRLGYESLCIGEGGVVDAENGERVAA